MNRLTHTVQRVIRLLTFLLACIVSAVEPTSSASGNGVRETACIGYDASVAYDCPETPSLDYNEAARPPTADAKHISGSARTLFGRFDESVAAETTVGGSLEEASALQARAQELNGLRRPWEASNGTTAVMNVQNVNTGATQAWIATESSGAMPQAWNGLLSDGEVFIQGPGHAEQTIVQALGNDWVITSGGASRNICIGTCQPLLEGQGLQLGGPVFRGMADKTPYRMFWNPQ